MHYDNNVPPRGEGTGKKKQCQRGKSGHRDLKAKAEGNEEKPQKIGKKEEKSDNE